MEGNKIANKQVYLHRFYGPEGGAHPQMHITVNEPWSIISCQQLAYFNPVELSRNYRCLNDVDAVCDGILSLQYHPRLGRAGAVLRRVAGVEAVGSILIATYSPLRPILTYYEDPRILISMGPAVDPEIQQLLFYVAGQPHARADFIFLTKYSCLGVITEKYIAWKAVWSNGVYTSPPVLTAGISHSEMWSYGYAMQ